MTRAIRFVGLIVLASLSFLSGCSDERKLLHPYHGAAFKNIIIGKPEDILKGDSLTVVANPNPFLDSTIIAFTPSDSSGWRLQIYATSGLKVWEFDSPAGSYIYHTVWKPKNLPAGIYHARITAGSKTGRLRIVYNPD